MHLKWNHVFGRVLASAVAANVALTGLYAIPRDPCEEPPPPVCCEEPKPGPFAFAYPFDMDLNCPRDFYFHVDGLAMQAKQDGMEFILRDSTTITSTTSLTNGEVEGFTGRNHDWKYQPGMRVGFGFYLDHDAWNLDFNWTWLNIAEYKKLSTGTSGGVLIPLWLFGASTPAGQIGPEASAVWNADYNTFDIKLAKPYHVSRYFVVSPHFGLRGAWIDQHFSVGYKGSTSTTQTTHHGDNDFWGVGARCGLNTDWILGKGWSLYGNLAASMLFGKFEIDQKLNLPGSGVDGYNVDYQYYQNTPNLEIVIGVGWGTFFNKKRNHVGLTAAYEFHEWFDQLNMRRFISGNTGIPGAGAGSYANDVVSRGNLSLNGFSLKLQFDI